MSTTARWTAAAAIAAMLLAGGCGKGSGAGAGGGGAGGGDPSDTGDGFDCGTCAAVFVNGGVPCDGTRSNDVYIALVHCACDACVAACSDSFCSGLPSNAACGDCLVTSCATEEMDCASN